MLIQCSMAEVCTLASTVLYFFSVQCGRAEVAGCQLEGKNITRPQRHAWRRRTIASMLSDTSMDMLLGTVRQTDGVLEWTLQDSGQRAGMPTMIPTFSSSPHALGVRRRVCLPCHACKESTIARAKEVRKKTLHDYHVQAIVIDHFLSIIGI